MTAPAITNFDKVLNTALRSFWALSYVKRLDALMTISSWSSGFICKFSIATFYEKC